MTAILTPGQWRPVLRLGDRGADVAFWQGALLHLGADLTGDDAGHFDHGTHNATLAFQREHHLVRDGDVGPKTRRALLEAGRRVPRNTPPDLPPLAPLDLSTLPYVEARWYRKVPEATPRPRNLIVLHCMQAPEQSTRAERCAANFSVTDRKASAHVNVDDDSAVRCVPDQHVAYGAPGANRTGLHIEHAGYARQTREQWLDAFGISMLRISARVTEAWSHQDGIPLEFLRAADLRAAGEGQARGFTTHHEVSEAFGKTNHHDPGKHFPIDWYLDRVRDVRAAREAVA